MRAFKRGSPVQQIPLYSWWRVNRTLCVKSAKFLFNLHQSALLVRPFFSISIKSQTHTLFVTNTSKLGLYVFYTEYECRCYIKVQDKRICSHTKTKSYNLHKKTALSLCEIYMNLARAFIIHQRDGQDRVKEIKVGEHSCASYCVQTVQCI